MYEKKEVLSKKLLAATLFRTAYGVDTVRQDNDAVYELFGFCAVALELHGWDTAGILDDLTDDQLGRATLIMNYVNGPEREKVGHSSEIEYLLIGMNNVLNSQFRESEPIERKRFLEGLGAFSTVS